MSQENVEIVRQTFGAMCRRDYQRAAGGFHQDAVWHNTREFPGPGVCVGPQAITEFWESLMESFEGETNVEQIIAGEDGIVLAAHTVGRGASGGVPLDVRWNLAFRVRGDKVSRVDVYGDRAKALKAVGLEE
jgi:ketosteroid isomerase-like protein